MLFSSGMKKLKFYLKIVENHLEIFQYRCIVIDIRHEYFNGGIISKRWTCSTYDYFETFFRRFIV